MLNTNNFRCVGGIKMEIIKIEDLSFSYSTQEKKALKKLEKELVQES